MPGRHGYSVLAGLAALAVAGAAAGQTQVDMSQQAGAKYKSADRALNATYAKLLAQGSPGGRTRLRTAQRDWLKFRDSDCAARTGSRGGSAYSMMLSLCLATLTEARTKQLKAALDCQEGDLSCSGHKED